MILCSFLSRIVGLFQQLFYTYTSILWPLYLLILLICNHISCSLLFQRVIRKHVSKPAQRWVERYMYELSFTCLWTLLHCTDSFNSWSVTSWQLSYATHEMFSWQLLTQVVDSTFHLLYAIQKWQFKCRILTHVVCCLCYIHALLLNQQPVAGVTMDHVCVNPSSGDTWQFWASTYLWHIVVFGESIDRQACYC